jgi:hypothetical protein
MIFLVKLQKNCGEQGLRRGPVVMGKELLIWSKILWIACFLFCIGCGSSANLNPSSERGGGSTSTPTLTSTDNSTGDGANMPEVSELITNTYILDCAGRDGDPELDYVTIRCALTNSSAEYLYYCVSGVVVRQIADDTTETTLYESITVECSNVSGDPTVTEEELIIS